jgi:hypothetical protein
MMAEAVAMACLQNVDEQTMGLCLARAVNRGGQNARIR